MARLVQVVDNSTVNFLREKKIIVGLKVPNRPIVLVARWGVNKKTLQREVRKLNNE